VTGSSSSQHERDEGSHEQCQQHHSYRIDTLQREESLHSVQTLVVPGAIENSSRDDSFSSLDGSKKFTSIFAADRAATQLSRQQESRRTT
jgi:hypothetical protein